MKYKNVAFNMSLAKHICDGSVMGKLYTRCNDKVCNVISHVETLPNGNEIFEIEFPKPYDSVLEVTFTPDGTSVDSVYNYVLALYIEIPVEDFCDDDIDAAIDFLSTQQAMLQKDTHYHKCKIEPIEYILANNLGFCEGNIVKYITRYKDKGKPLDDLRKIKVYVDYIIDDLTKQQDGHQ